MMTEIPLADAIATAGAQMKGQTRGRVVVNVNG